MPTTRTSLREYAVYTDNPQLQSVIDYAQTHDLYYEVHLNRTRVLVPEGHIRTEFLLKFGPLDTVQEYREYR